MSIPKTLLTALVLAFTPFGAQAAERPLEVRFDLSEAAFHAANSEMLGKGLRLADITVAEVQGKAVIGAIWQRPTQVKPASPERVKQLQALLFLKQSPEALDQTGSRLVAAGSSLEVIDSYASGGKTVFAATFSPSKEAPVAATGAFMTINQVAEMRAKAQEKNFDFMRLEVYKNGDTLYYLPSFVARPKTSTDVVDAADPAQFHSEANLAAGKPLSISVYDQGKGVPSYYGMFDSGTGRSVKLDRSAADFRKDVDALLAKGGFVLDIDSFVKDGAVRYSAVFQQPGG